MALVLFDLDGTLLSTSSERHFFSYLNKHKKLGLKQWACFMWFCLRHSIAYRKHVFKKNKAYLSGLKKEEVTALAKTYVKQQLSQYYRPKVIARLEQHLAAGDTVILLTGTLQEIAEAISVQLSTHGVCATKCVLKNDRYTCQAPSQHPFGIDKLKLAKQLCEQQRTDLSQVTAYGDAIYDAALLEKVGTAVATYPDKQLLAIAKMQRWEIIS